MTPLWSARPSSSSSPSSDKKESMKGKSKSSNDILKSSNDQRKKKMLTRARKLRYLTDDEVGFNNYLNGGGDYGGEAQSCPVSPDSGSGSRAPNWAGSDHWSKSAVPQPLPLPVKNQDLMVNKHVFDTHGSVNTRNHTHQNSEKATDKSIKQTNQSQTNPHRKFPRDLKLETSENGFRSHIPTKSAPITGCSSPVLSPQRYRTVDFHHSFNLSPLVESSNSDRIISKSHHVSPGQSPVHSPRFQSPADHIASRKCSCVLQHSYNKSIPENVHPLPRPPTASRSSPTTRNSFDKSDASSLIMGQWQKGRAIGRGTYGTVYVATNRETGATCAMKEVDIIPDDTKCVESVKQLEQEMKFLRDLKHPNIVQYYGSEIIDDRFCIYLEYVHPGSICKYVNEHCGAMTESIVRNFTRHILSGLAYLHNTKTIHRDIKGANLLVDASGVVKLADFGLAKHLGGHNIELSLKGTPHWMAPEVLKAAMRKDSNPELAYGVDIWGVGCTVIEMLTGKPPWSELIGVQAMFNVLNKSPPIPETLSAEGKDFLHLCFQKRPEDRPSAAKLLEHPFLRSSSQDQNVSGYAQEFCGLKLAGVQTTSGDWTWKNKEIMPLLSAPKGRYGKNFLNGETSRKSYPEPSELGTSHQSPRSILEEVHLRVSSPDINRCSNISSPASHVQENLLLKAVTNNAYSFSCKGNITLLMPKTPERRIEPRI